MGIDSLKKVIDGVRKKLGRTPVKGSTEVRGDVVKGEKVEVEPKKEK